MDGEKILAKIFEEFGDGKPEDIGNGTIVKAKDGCSCIVLYDKMLFILSSFELARVGGIETPGLTLTAFDNPDLPLKIDDNLSTRTDLQARFSDEYKSLCQKILKRATELAATSQGNK